MADLKSPDFDPVRVSTSEGSLTARAEAGDGGAGATGGTNLETDTVFVAHPAG